MCWSIEPAPADCPHIVTLVGSPPKEAIFDIHHYQGKEDRGQTCSYVLLDPCEGKLLIDLGNRDITLLFLVKQGASHLRSPALRLPPSLTFCPGKNPMKYPVSPVHNLCAYDFKLTKESQSILDTDGDDAVVRGLDKILNWVETYVPCVIAGTMNQREFLWKATPRTLLHAYRR